MEQNMYDFDREARKRFVRDRARKWIIAGGIAVVALLLLSQSFFVVGEAEQAVVSRFGVIRRLVLNNGNTFHQDYAAFLDGEITTSGQIKVENTSGLHLKMPFVDNVQSYSSRMFTYVSDSEVVNTAEKKQYYIRTYAQWSIEDPALFSLKLGSMTSAENQLDNLIHPVLVQAINRDMAPRGIEVKDIQVHRTILPSANIESTYARMKADRTKVAQQLRSEGEESYLKAVASADLEARLIEAQALSEAGVIRGDGDAAALEIYANAYSADEDFYAYWRSLQALEKALDENATLILDKEHPLWKDLLTYATGYAQNK